MLRYLDTFAKVVADPVSTDFSRKCFVLTR